MRSPWSAVSIPDPTPVLFLAALTVALIWSTETNGPTVMLVTAAMPRLFIEIGGLKARPEHMVAGLLVVALFFALKKRQDPVRWVVADYFLLAYIAMNFVSSWFTSVAPMQTTKWAMRQVLVILPYFLLRLLAGNASAFRRAFQVVLAVGA